MSVLSDLFQDIADAIREKTGGTATFPPIKFPEEIGKIVVGGGESGDNMRVATGTVNSAISGTGMQTITHGLEEYPDFVGVFTTLSNGILTESNPRVVGLAFSYGFNSKFSLDNYGQTGTFSSYAEGYTFLCPFLEKGIDKYTKNSVYTPSKNTFQFGSSDVPLVGSYTWIAIAGMGGPVAYPNAEEQKF